MNDATRKRAIWLIAVGYLVAVASWALLSSFSSDIAQAITGGRVEAARGAETGSETPDGGGLPLRFYRARLDGMLNAGLVTATGLSLLALCLLSRIAWLRLVASNLAIFFLLAVGAEVGLRVAGIESERIARTGLTDRGVWSYDSSKGWYHQSHTTGTSNLGGPDQGAIRINSLGLRDRERTLEKPPGVKRILVFGDSYVFGVGVDGANVLSSRLQALLDEDSGQVFEVLNLGVSGYSTDQEYLLFRELGLRLEPDVIVLVVCQNDPDANVRDFVYDRYYKPIFELDDAGVLEAESRPVPRLSPWQRGKVWLSQESELWNYLRSRQSDAAGVQAVLDFFHVAVSAPTDDDPLAVTAQIIRRFSEEAAAAGVPVLVTTTAGRAGIDDAAGTMRRADAALAAQLADAPLDWLDLWPVLIEARGAAPELHWDFDPNPHWNVDAHRVAAEALVRRLRASGML